VAHILSHAYWVDYGTGRDGFWRLPENQILWILLLQFQLLCYNSNRLHCPYYLGTSIAIHPLLFQKVRCPTKPFRIHPPLSRLICSILLLTGYHRHHVYFDIMTSAYSCCGCCKIRTMTYEYRCEFSMTHYYCLLP
jgi:hypothetical protein